MAGNSMMGTDYSPSLGKISTPEETTVKDKTIDRRLFSWRNPVLWILLMAVVGLALIFLGLIALGYG